MSLDGIANSRLDWLSWGRICPRVTKMESITGHRKDYNGVGAPRGQRHIRIKSY